MALKDRSLGEAGGREDSWGQMTKDLEGLAKQVGLGSSCGDLGTSQREEAQEMGKGA